MRPPRGAAEGRAIFDRGFPAAVRSVGGWRRPSWGDPGRVSGEEVWLSQSRCFASRGLCGAAGHSNRGFAQPQGGGRKAEHSPGAGRKSRGMAKGAKTPWLRSLPTFCRMTESRSLRGLSGGEERVIFSPRGSGLRKQAGSRVFQLRGLQKEGRRRGGPRKNKS